MLLFTSLAAAALGSPAPGPLGPGSPAPDLIALAPDIADGAHALAAVDDALPTHAWHAWAGELSIEGHLARPGDIRTVPAEARMLAEDGVLAVSLGIAWEGDASWMHAAVVGDRILELGPDGWREAAAPNEVWRDVLQLHPAGLLAPLSDTPRSIGSAFWGSVQVERLDFDDPEVGRWMLAVGPGDRLVGAVRRWPDGRLGDVVDALQWGDGDVPSAIQLSRGGPDPLELGLRHLGECPPPAGWTPPEPSGAEIGVEVLAEGVYALTIPAADSRSLVLEYRDHLILIEAPLTSGVGEQILATLRDRWPDKPVREVFFGHHHPHYTGALRALAAAGATIRCTEGQRPAVDGLLAAEHTIVPDAWAQAAGAAEIHPFEGRTVVRGKGPRLVAIDIAAHSQHTDSYVVFWLPQSRILFQGDLGYYADGEGLAASGRARGLLEGLAEAKIEPETVVQSWMLGVPTSVSFEDLAALAGP